MFGQFFLVAGGEIDRAESLEDMLEITEIGAIFNHLDAEITQRGIFACPVPILAVAVFAARRVSELAVAAGVISGDWAWALSAVLLIAAVLVVMGLSSWKRPAALELTGTELKVTALVGLFPLRRVRRVLPLETLEWHWEDVGLSADGMPQCILTLQSGDAPPLRLSHLGCGPDQQAALNVAWTAARDRARQLEGDGAAEIPAALANLRAQAVEPPKG